MATESQCEKALDFFEEQLSQITNVVGLGIVPAKEGRERGPRDCAVAVYVKKKVPANRLAAKDLVPTTLTLPGSKRDVEIPTRVIEQGEVELERLT